MAKFDEGSGCTESSIPLLFRRTWMKKRCVILCILATATSILLLVSHLTKSRTVEIGSDSRSSSKWEIYLPSTKTQQGYCPTKGSVGDNWIRTVYSDVPKDSKCSTRVERIGNTGDGGKLVCLDDIIPNACIVYSLGSRLDFSFEIDVVKRLGCVVHTFDCTVGNPKGVPFGVSFHPWCVGGQDEQKIVSSDLGHQGETGQYYTLATIMSKLNHRNVDLLKMDIERYEFAVVDSLQNGYIPWQIVFETHLQNAYGMWGRPVTEKEWNILWAKLRSLGYGVFSNEPNPLCRCCCEWSLLRKDARRLTTVSYTHLTLPTILLV